MLPQPDRVAGDTAGDVEERWRAAGGAKTGQIGLGEALVLADQGRRKVDIFDLSGANELGERQRRLAAPGPAGIDDGERHVVERLRPAAAEVEDAARLRMIEEPEVDGNDVVDVDEIAPLLAGRVAAIGAEQLDAARRLPLLELVEGDRRHAPLVLLARPV